VEACARAGGEIDPDILYEGETVGDDLHGWQLLSPGPGARGPPLEIIRISGRTAPAAAGPLQKLRIQSRVG
jgi:hypothetical protein